ncbi:hypothetical protein J7337_011535 [Fusarium musae]|uniref:N-acetyltransferase domain-containing protein n=1 Tax=Fusarium musae TaxID=1042133 RepID=A0A9P8D7M5_9HYPO|nr:hypothetical protein J7337_011535 [Fusarium musae]KAG9496752.1 hypothetical protein J7337_011535 [Fusarium musae]
MSGYQLQSPCRVEDGLLIAQSQVSAFFEEAWWRLSWTDRTRESLIQSIADRSPKNLLTNREVRRHQKIVHLETGDIVGYARWILPESHKDAWLEAQTPDVSDEQREVFARRHAETDWNPREDNDKLDDHIGGWREKHKQERDMDHQQKGLASLLVNSGLEEAKKLRINVIIVAMGRRALGLYLKHGFELLEEKSQSMSYFGIDKLYETFYLRKKAEK